MGFEFEFERKEAGLLAGRCEIEIWCLLMKKPERVWGLQQCGAAQKV